VPGVEREQGLSLLASRGWLSGTPEEFRERFLSLAQWRLVEQGTPVTLGGEERDDILGLAEGTVLMTSTLAEPDTPAMHMAHAVIWLGYAPLFLDQPRRITVEARTPLKIASFPKARVLALLAETPVWWRCFLPLGFEYGDACAVIASDLLIGRSDRRLAATILRFAGLRGSRIPPCHQVRLPVTQAELAGASNLSRNVAATILREFSAQGWIEIEYRGLVLRDPKGLRRFLATEAQ
jgi:CRP-like cAMP-binding protein